MTLFRQITAVFTLFFLAMLAIVLTISFNDSRDYIENELYTKAQNTASTLAVSMSQADGDVTKMSVMAEAVFDTGYYRRILFKDTSGAVLFEEHRNERAPVPPWFEKMVHLRPSPARAQVSNGWQPVGILEVTSDETESLLYLYKLFKKIVLVFFFSTLIGLTIVGVMLKVILRPIGKMEEQAEGVLRNRFILNREIPGTTELKRMTEAMNALVGRMERMHEKLVELTKRNRDLEYGDPVTGLYNRRYFTVHYEELITSGDSRSSGTVMVLHLTNAAEANKKVGYDRVNGLFKRIGEIVSEKSLDFEESVVCRISGVEIAWLIPAAENGTVEKLAADIFEKTREEIDRLDDLRDIVCLAGAIVSYTKQRPIEKLLSTIDLTLNSVITLNCDSIKVSEFEGSLPVRKTQWRELIAGAIEHRRLKPVLANIFSENGRDISAELLFDLITDSDERISYRVYAPMMMQLGLFPDYVDFAFDYLLQGPSLQCRRISMEFPMEYLDTTHTFESLLSNIKKLRKTDYEFVVEIGQNGLVRRDAAVIESIVEELARHDISVAIARFDADTRMLELLHIVRPVYVKMHIGPFLDMSDTLRDSLTLLLRSIGTKLLISGVETQEDLEKLGERGNDYYVI